MYALQSRKIKLRNSNKKDRHIIEENSKMMCLTFLSMIKFEFYKQSAEKPLLACLFNSNCTCNSHTNHGVVTCTDKAHHFNVSGN